MVMRTTSGRDSTERRGFVRRELDAFRLMNGSKDSKYNRRSMDRCASAPLPAADGSDALLNSPVSRGDCHPSYNTYRLEREKSGRPFGRALVSIGPTLDLV